MKKYKNGRDINTSDDFLFASRIAAGTSIAEFIVSGAMTPSINLGILAAAFVIANCINQPSGGKTPKLSERRNDSSPRP